MNTFLTIVEVVELGALIALVIYLVRLTRDNNELRDTLNKSELVDRSLEEINEFNSSMVADPDLARIWQDGCEDYRLNDIDRSRFSLMASSYLAMLANQKQRADSIEDWAQAEVATNRLIEALMVNPGLAGAWETLSGKIASPELRAAVSQALCPPDMEESTAVEATVENTEERAEEPASQAAAAPPPVTAEAASDVLEEPDAKSLAESIERSEAEALQKVQSQVATAESAGALTDSDNEVQETVAETTAVTVATAVEQDTTGTDSQADEDTRKTVLTTVEKTTTVTEVQDEEPRPNAQANTAVSEQDTKSDTSDDAKPDVAVAKPA